MKLVFTNGCFDGLHPGHLSLLEYARGLGDRLVVAINSDASVRALKGLGRPLFTALDRRRMLLALRCVDEVRLFDTEEHLLQLITKLRPAVLVKGGQYCGARMPGSEFAGKVSFAPMVPGFSTTNLIERIRRLALPTDGRCDPVALATQSTLAPAAMPISRRR
jgi:D-beta-D-heptose 7-phosphate kinase/D-beta-D-heptose 1-phosphate adenosyltransferase